MGNKFIRVLFLSILSYSCNRKLINQISEEENLSSSASIVADSTFYKKVQNDPYWPEKPDIQFLYASLFGLDQTSSFLREGNNCKVFTTEPVYLWGQEINKPVVLFPGETISIQAAEFGNVKFVSSDERRTRELKDFDVLSEAIEKKLQGYAIFHHQYELMQTASPLIVDSIVKWRLHNGKESLILKIDSLVKTDNIALEFKKEMLNYLSAKVFNSELDYFLATRAFFESRKAPIPETRYGELISWGNAIQSHGELKYYYFSLWELLKLLTIGRSRFFNIFDTTSFQVFIRTIKDNFQGLTKDFLMADALCLALRNKVIGPDSLRIYAQKECSNKIYRLVLEKLAGNSEVVEKYATAENGKFLLPFDSKTTVSEDNLFDRYKGKLILVDFWSSWCIPCRRELPLMQELKREYATKDIVFLTISIDKKFLDWQRANSAEKLSPEESFMLNTNDSVFMFKGNLIESIPRYLLFSKDGSLIDANAPSPGTEKLKEMIDKYLRN